MHWSQPWNPNPIQGPWDDKILQKFPWAQAKVLGPFGAATPLNPADTKSELEPSGTDNQLTLRLFLLRSLVSLLLSKRSKNSNTAYAHQHATGVAVLILYGPCWRCNDDLIQVLPLR